MQFEGNGQVSHFRKFCKIQVTKLSDSLTSFSNIKCLFNAEFLLCQSALLTSLQSVAFHL